LHGLGSCYPAQLHSEQWCVDVERPHGADLAHGDGHPDVTDRRLPGSYGPAVSNSFRYFKPDGTTQTGVSFAYWTAPLFDPAGSGTDTTPEMINENGKIAPAPWVPFTRAGCDFGAVATANTILENTAIDIPTVFRR